MHIQSRRKSQLRVTASLRNLGSIHGFERFPFGTLTETLTATELLAEEDAAGTKIR